MRGSPVETLQRIQCSRASLPGYHSTSMDPVLNPRTESCTGATGCGMGPRPSRAALTAPLQRRKPGRGCLGVLIPPPTARPTGVEGSWYLCMGHTLVIVSWLQPGPVFALRSARTATLNFRQLLQTPLFHLPCCHTARSPVPCPSRTAQCPTLSDTERCKDKLFNTAPVPTLSVWTGKKNIHFC